MAAQKVVEVDREKIISILNLTLSSEPGSEIFIPCSSKKEQRDTYTCVVRELKVMSEIDANDSASITHRAIFRDGQFWIVLKRIIPTLSAVYVKDKNGNLSKKSITTTK